MWVLKTERTVSWLPYPSTGDNVKINYIRKPTAPKWGYVVVSGKALHDPTPTKTADFELHPSEEVELVYKILKLAGVAIQRDDLMKAGQTMEIEKVQQEKQ